MFGKDDDAVARIWRNGALQLMRQSGEHAESASAWADNARQWRAYAKDLEAQLAAAQLALAVKTADAEGLEAHKAAFIKAHPQSPVRADSGKRYKDGNIKSVGRLIYEATFDRILRGAGIADPAKHRAD